MIPVISNVTVQVAAITAGTVVTVAIPGLSAATNATVTGL